jgi:hypothetical protein
LSFSSARRKELKEASTPSKASPYMGRMQPLLLSLRHLGKLGPSKVPLVIYWLREMFEITVGKPIRDYLVGFCCVNLKK